MSEGYIITHYLACCKALSQMHVAKEVNLLGGPRGRGGGVSCAMTMMWVGGCGCVCVWGGGLQCYCNYLLLFNICLSTYLCLFQTQRLARP